MTLHAQQQKSKRSFDQSIVQGKVNPLSNNQWFPIKKKLLGTKYFASKLAPTPARHSTTHGKNTINKNTTESRVLLLVLILTRRYCRCSLAPALYNAQPYMPKHAKGKKKKRQPRPLSGTIKFSTNSRLGAILSRLHTVQQQSPTYYV